MLCGTLHLRGCTLSSSFIFVILCPNIFVQYSSILFIYSLRSHSSHGFHMPLPLAQSLLITEHESSVRAPHSRQSELCHMRKSYVVRPFSWIRKYQKSNQPYVERLGVSWDLLLVWLMPRGLCYHVRWLLSKPGTAFNTIQYFSEVNQNPKPANRSLSWAWAN